jgi:hypothetical protein
VDPYFREETMEKEFFTNQLDDKGGDVLGDYHSPPLYLSTYV